MWECNNPATDCGTAPACEMYRARRRTSARPSRTRRRTAWRAALAAPAATARATSRAQTCGNGVVEGTEQCDFGTGNGPGTGCETNCTYSCQTSTDCSDGNLCDGTETCNTVTVSGHTGKKCAAGTPLTNGTTCGTGKICLSSQCVTSTCGDGYIDTAAGETCEPPNVGTCDSQCHNASCGDGILAGSEQCDDGNHTNLDGCDASCKFEQVHRVNVFKIAFAHDTFCPKDALGEAIVGVDFGSTRARAR